MIHIRAHPKVLSSWGGDENLVPFTEPFLEILEIPVKPLGYWEQAC